MGSVIFYNDIFFFVLLTPANLLKKEKPGGFTTGLQPACNTEALPFYAVRVPSAHLDLPAIPWRTRRKPLHPYIQVALS